MRRRFATLAAVASIFAAVPAVGPVAPSAVIAKSCGGGYKHGVINGAHKCLRRGQYCARGADRQYHHYGYHCHKQDRNGDYHLT